MKKIVFTVLTLFWMVLIFWFSSKPADESGNMSLSIGHIIGSVFVSGFEEQSDREREQFAERIDYPVRKTAHAAEYAVLGGLLMATLGSYSVNGSRKFLLCLLGGAAYAGSDEFHQLFIPGRSGQLSDVLLDSAGVLAGLLIYEGMAQFCQYRRNKKKKE